MGAHVMGGGEVEGAGGVLPRGHSGRRSPAAAVSYNCFPFILGSVSTTQHRCHSGDFLMENWLTNVDMYLYTNV